jgi:hypothetical protein
MLALCFPNFLQRESLLAKLTPAGDSRTVTLWATISIRKRDCRKLVLAPEGTSVTTAALRRHIDTGMVKVVARALCWRDPKRVRALVRSAGLRPCTHAGVVFPYFLTERSSSVF